MKLPNRKKAYIAKTKLTEYILSETHPVGSSKAKFFRVLGFDEENVGELMKAFKDIALAGQIVESRESIYGINYSVDAEIKAPIGKKVMITTVWFIKKGGKIPSFVTAYPV